MDPLLTALQRNAFTVPLDAADPSMTPDLCWWPVTNQTASSARLNLSELDLLDHSAVGNKRLVDVPGVRPMDPQLILVFERLLKEVVWMCDVTLETATKDHLWRQYFKNQRHRCAIEGIYTDVRALVWSLLDRGKAKKPILADLKLQILIIHKENAEAYGHIASTYMSQHTIVFWPWFMNGWQAWDRTDTNELRSNLVGADSLEAKHVHGSRAGTLLHELVHYVSYITWNKFTSRLKKHAYIERQLSHASQFITDVDAAKYATKYNKSDSAILQKFRDKNWTSTKHYNGVQMLSSYGLGVAEHLAQLKSGGMATLLNADNYLAFASAVCAEYLEDELNEAPLTVEQLLSLKPFRRG